MSVSACISLWDKWDFTRWDLTFKSLWCFSRSHTHTHNTHTPPHSLWGSQVVGGLWSPLMTPLAIQVCVGQPRCLTRRRPFLSELCQAEEHSLSPWFPPTTFPERYHTSALPTPRVWCGGIDRGWGPRWGERERPRSTLLWNNCSVLRRCTPKWGQSSRGTTFSDTPTHQGGR